MRFTLAEAGRQVASDYQNVLRKAANHRLHVLVRVPPADLAALLREQRVLRQLLAALARERWALLSSR